MTGVKKKKLNQYHITRFVGFSDAVCSILSQRVCVAYLSFTSEAVISNHGLNVIPPICSPPLLPDGMSLSTVVLYGGSRLCTWWQEAFFKVLYCSVEVGEGEKDGDAGGAGMGGWGADVQCCVWRLMLCSCSAPSKCSNLGRKNKLPSLEMKSKPWKFALDVNFK